MSSSSLPHICIDATCIVSKGKGASVYAKSLIESLQILDPPARFSVFVRKEMAGDINIHRANWSILPVRIRSAHLWHLLSIPRILKRMRPALIHVLTESVLGRMPVPYILTAIELPHLYRQIVGDSPKSWYPFVSHKVMESFLPHTCRRSARLITLSRSTANDLINEFEINPDRISVIHAAAGDRFFQAESWPTSDWCQSLPRPYLLTFATGDHREAPEQVVEAFANIVSGIPHHLVVAGSCPDWQRRSMERLAAHFGCLDRVHFTGFVPDNDLPILYRDAVVYIEMSRYEGFGLQVCEAMATGTVVIVSDIASFREIIGSAGDRVPLGDSRALANRLSVLLNLNGELERLSILAKRQASAFSWKKCASETWEAMQCVLSKGHLHLRGKVSHVNS